MQSITHETLTAHLLEIPGLVDRYARQDPTFVTATLTYLQRVSESAARLRHPLAGFVSGRRGLIVAAGDGHRIPGVDAQSQRKAVRATAAAVLAEVDAEIRRRLEPVEASLEQATEQMAQLVAVAIGAETIPARGKGSREAWLESVWTSMPNGNGSAGLYQYLTARLNRVDRLYVLDRVMSNVEA